MKRFIALMLVALLTTALLSGCHRQRPDGENADGKTTLRFWASGQTQLNDVLQELVDNFNNTNKDGIMVNFQARPINGYESSLQNVLSFSSAPDVFLFEDRYLKKWATMDLLAPLDSYIAGSELKTEDMWSALLSRFRYSVKDNYSDESSPLYALPCGTIPSIVFYNKTVFKDMGIDVVSKDYSDELSEEYKHGFYHSGTLGQIPVKGEKMVFNDRIPMTWEELKDIAMYLNKSYNVDARTDYGFYCHWWFNFGWSVGGDVVQYDKTTKEWHFSLGDKTRKKNADGQEMPSMYEALDFYLKMIQKKSSGGWELMPSQSEVDTLGNQVYFLSQKVAMLTDVADMISIFEEKSTFEWGIAPIPKHSLGINAGHSQAKGLGIWNKSKNKDAAYKFAEYLASEEAQKKLAISGNFVPNQRNTAYEVYDSENYPLSNGRLLAEVSEYERPGDWTYMPDDAWINEWAPLLNNAVRNSNMTLDEFLAQVTDKTNIALKRSGMV